MSGASALRAHCREINLGQTGTPHPMGPFQNLAFALHAGILQGRLHSAA